MWLCPTTKGLYLRETIFKIPAFHPPPLPSIVSAESLRFTRWVDRYVFTIISWRYVNNHVLTLGRLEKSSLHWGSAHLYCLPRLYASPPQIFSVCPVWWWCPVSIATVDRGCYYKPLVLLDYYHCCMYLCEHIICFVVATRVCGVASDL